LNSTKKEKKHEETVDPVACRSACFALPDDEL
jgi:hypothetical protein